jgi:hypothetical protein
MAKKPSLVGLATLIPMLENSHFHLKKRKKIEELFFNLGRKFPFGGRECSPFWSIISLQRWNILPRLKKKVNRISYLKSWEGK